MPKAIQNKIGHTNLQARKNFIKTLRAFKILYNFQAISVRKFKKKTHLSS